MKIVIAGPRHARLERGVAELARERAGAELALRFAASREALLEEVADAEVLAPVVDPELFARARKLRWVHLVAAGVDHRVFPALLESGVVLTSAKGIVGTHLAEHAFALLLALTRGVAKAARERRWNGRGYRIDELTDQVMGIVGLGSAGREIARRARAFGMRVLAVDPSDAAKPDDVDALWKPERLPQLLREADVVVIAAPLTDRTRGLFDARAFSQMKPSALLVNVSRGGIVDTHALRAALRDGSIAGAALDVVAGEPLAEDDPLWSLENVVLTPHVAGRSPRRRERFWNLFLENLRRWVEGRPLLAVFDRERGF